MIEKLKSIKCSSVVFAGETLQSDGEDVVMIRESSFIKMVDKIDELVDEFEQWKAHTHLTEHGDVCHEAPTFEGVLATPHRILDKDEAKVIASGAGLPPVCDGCGYRHFPGHTCRPEPKKPKPYYCCECGAIKDDKGKSGNYQHYECPECDHKSTIMLENSNPKPKRTKLKTLQDLFGWPAPQVDPNATMKFRVLWCDIDLVLQCVERLTEVDPNCGLSRELREEVE